MLPPHDASGDIPDKVQYESSRGSFFSKVQSIFFSIAEKIIRQTKKADAGAVLKGRMEHQKVPLTAEQEVLLQQEVRELQALRQELAKEVGENAPCIMMRFIDSCLSRFKEVDEFSHRERPSSEPLLVSSDVIKQIISLRGGQLIKKVRKDLLEKVQKSIYDDLAYIASYQEMVPAREGYASAEIETIVSLLLDLLKSAPKKDNVLILYRWKRAIDMFRQGLVSLAIAILDEEDVNSVREEGYAEEHEQELERIAELLREVLTKEGVWLHTRYHSDSRVCDRSHIEANVASLLKSVELFIAQFVGS